MKKPLDKTKSLCYNKDTKEMRDAREDPKTRVVAVRRNPTKTSTAWCVGVRYRNVNQRPLAEVMRNDAYYKAKFFLKSA